MAGNANGSEIVTGDKRTDDVHAALRQFPRWPIGNFPSPIRQAASHDGHRFWIKDDGRCSDVYGGNKVRKLEYLLAEVQRRQKKVLVVHGDVESHTVQACGIWGSQAGLEVHTVVFPHRNQSLNVPALSRLREIPVRVYLQRTMLGAVLQAHWIGWRKHGYVVPLGASTPIATVGYVQAALELREQISAGLLPEPRSIYLPFATGGSVAGLLIGLTLADMATRVVAVQTVDGIIANQKRLERLVKKTLAVLGADSGHFHRCMSRLDFIDRQNLGSGYRDVPLNVAEAVTVARQHGLQLEPVFSGKAFAALLDTLPKFPNGELLFWNTHDQHNPAAISEGKQ
jgi:D-cysteine desulfhydrase